MCRSRSSMSRVGDSLPFKRVKNKLYKILCPQSHRTGNTLRRKEGRITMTDSKLILNLILERRDDRSCLPQRPSLLDFDYQFVQVYMSKIEFKRQNGDLLPSSTQYGLVFPIFHETRQQDMPWSLLAEQAEQSVATGDLHYSHSCPSQSLEPCSDFNACFTGAIARDLPNRRMVISIPKDWRFFDASVSFARQQFHGGSVRSCGLAQVLEQPCQLNCKIDLLTCRLVDTTCSESAPSSTFLGSCCSHRSGKF